MKLPLGIYYEPARERYRVRVYKFNKVTHCSYHKDLGEAMAALDIAKEERELLTPDDKKPIRGATVKTLLRRLK